MTFKSKLNILVAVMMMLLLAGCFDSSDTLLLSKQVERYEQASPIVKVFYVSHETPRPDVVNCIKRDIQEVQSQFAEEMSRHGYGRKTFDIDTDDTGDVRVTWIQTAHPAEHYEYFDKLSREHREFYGRDNIHLFFIGFSIPNFCGIASRSPGGTIDNYSYSDWGGNAYVSWHCWGGGKYTKPLAVNWTFDNWDCDAIDENPHGIKTWDHYAVAHELGHAFGLGHNWSNGEFIMSYGWTDIGGCNPNGDPAEFRECEKIYVEHRHSKISPEAAAGLNQHPAFN